MNSLGLYTFILIYLFQIGSFSLTGQSEYYSKSVGERGDIGIYDAAPLEGGAR